MDSDGHGVRRPERGHGRTSLIGLLPQQLGRNYRGSSLAIWLLVALALSKIFQGINVASRSGFVLETVDRVPLHSFPAAAASHLEFLFAVWGLCIAILGAVGLLAIMRYREMIPLAFALLLIEQFGRMILAVAYLDRPVLPATLSPAFLVNWAFLATTAVGFLLSLRASTPEAASTSAART